MESWNGAGVDAPGCISCEMFVLWNVFAAFMTKHSARVLSSLFYRQPMPAYFFAQGWKIGSKKPWYCTFKKLLKTQNSKFLIFRFAYCSAISNTNKIYFHILVVIFEFWRHLTKTMWHGEWCVECSSWVLRFAPRFLCTLRRKKTKEKHQKPIVSSVCFCCIHVWLSFADGRRPAHGQPRTTKSKWTLMSRTEDEDWWAAVQHEKVSLERIFCSVSVGSFIHRYSVREINWCWKFVVDSLALRYCVNSHSSHWFVLCCC